MTKKQRSFLFFLMVFLFIIAGPLIVLYFQGYRIDFQNRQIVQTGAFYFRIMPKSVRIEINSLIDEKIKISSTDFIFGTAYIENLLPRKYEVKVSKKNYHNWTKELKIDEKMATEVKNITLIPEKPKFEILIEKVEDLFYFPETDIFIIKNQDVKKWSLLKQDKRTELFSSFFSSDSEGKLINLINLNKPEKLIIEIEENKIINYY